MENEYKTAWRLASGHTHVQRKQKTTSKKKSPSMAKQMQKEIAVSAGIGIAMGALTHAAQSQLKGRMGIALRITGRVGLRAVPVIAVGLTVYDAYKFLSED